MSNTNVFKGPLSSIKNYHKAMAVLAEQYEDGLLSVSEVNWYIMGVCGEHYSTILQVAAAYKRNIIMAPTPEVSNEKT